MPVTGDLPEGAYLATVVGDIEPYSLNLRKEPSLEAEVIMKLDCYQELVVLRALRRPRLGGGPHGCGGGRRRWRSTWKRSPAEPENRQTNKGRPVPAVEQGGACFANRKIYVRRRERVFGGTAGACPGWKAGGKGPHTVDSLFPCTRP